MNDIPPRLQQLAENLHDKIRSAVESHIDIDPVLFLFTCDEKEESGFCPKFGLVKLAQFMSSDCGKDIVTELMQDAIAEDGIDVLVMVTEAWLARTPPGTTREEAMSIRPSERPDREEVVLLNIMTKTSQYIGSSKFVRGPSPTLEPLEIFQIEGDQSMEGRFVRSKEDTPKTH